MAVGEKDCFINFGYEKKEFINRWYTAEGAALLSKIFNAFSRKASLSEIQGLSKVDNRWDLRGAPLSSVLNETTIGNSEHQLSLKSGSLKVKNYCFDHVDFSFAVLDHCELYQCKFQNCEFTGVQGNGMHIYACNFDNCTFERTDFSYSFINKNIYKDAGSFTNCKFLKAILKECIFTFPKIEDCLFEDCNLYACNFDGSRMKNVKFIGKIDSSWFNGYSKKADKSVFWIFNKINPKELPNPMYNVDFSDAELFYVAFSNGIDLSNCIFPEDQTRYLYIQHLREVNIRAIEIINTKWEGRDQEIALNLMNTIYLSDSKLDQKTNFISLDPNRKNDVKAKLFKLFKELNELIDNEKSIYK